MVSQTSAFARDVKSKLASSARFLSANLCGKGDVFSEWRSNWQHLIPWKDFNSLHKEDLASSGQSSLVGYPVRYTDPKAFLGMVREVWREKNYQIQLKNEGTIRVLDCGANIGIGVLYWLNRHSNVHITAIEADPAISKVLEHNVKVWADPKSQQVEIVTACVATHNNGVRFLCDGSWGGRVAPSDNGDGQSIELPTVDILQLIDGPIDLLKVDIEGSEVETLWYAREAIAKHVNHMFVEWHSLTGQKQELGRFLQFFENAGFRYHIREASMRHSPFTNRRENWPMDSQLDCFFYRPGS